MNRFALLIGNAKFRNYQKLDLLTPPNDIRELEDALVDSSRGGYKVQTLVDAESGQVRSVIESVLKGSAEDDGLALIYYSGHGLLDPENHLYLAASDTRPKAFAETIPISHIINSIRIYRPRRVIVLLDCCYSGAAGTDFELKGTSDETLSLDELAQSEGVVMITATTPIQRALGNTNTGLGVFTRFLIDGIKKGRRRRTVTDI